MVQSFIYDAQPARILFGAGRLSDIGDELQHLGVRRAFIVCGPGHHNLAQALQARLGALAAGLFDQAAMHTPVDVTLQALAAYEATGADSLVALGGGSAIGLAKALAYRTGAPQIAVPTTYAGSEVTPILGQTEHGVKTTVRHPSILPRTVVYDPELSTSLPVAMSVESGLNAMAHAVEGLYARDRNPVCSLMAVEGVRALQAALPVIVQRPGDLAARSEALYGAWLCGTVLGNVGMSLHHKLCHTLGGSFNLPHAATHAVLLPHCAAYNAQAAAEELAPLAALFGGRLGAGLHAFAGSLGAPTRLRDLGLDEARLDQAADLAVQHPYWNPRPVERAAIRELLQHAWEGRQPD